MHNSTTRFWKKKSLSQYVHREDGSLTLLTLFSLGVLAALMHQHLRMGLNIPGHHGLEWMTLLLFGRMLSKDHWATVIIASGAATAYIVQATYMPLTESFKPVAVYMLNGVCLDLLFRYTPRNLPALIKGPILGGVTFALKPILLIPIAVLFELNFGSFGKHGYLYPVLTHFVFGSIGAICGITLANLMSGNKTKSKADLSDPE